MIYIFLDIDGVLIKKGDFVPFVYDDLEAKCLKLFESTLRKYSGKYKIVITSSWKEIFNLDFIKSKFSRDIASNILAFTPFLRSYQKAKFYRYEEILEYFKENSLENVRWLAIDDTKEIYPLSIHNILIVPDAYEGFNATDADNLDKLLQQFLEV